MEDSTIANNREKISPGQHLFKWLMLAETVCLSPLADERGKGATLSIVKTHLFSIFMQKNIDSERDS